MADLVNEEKPAIAPPVFVFQKEKGAKRSADGSSGEDGEDSDKEDACYCPPVKRERTSSQTQFPPSHSVSKNNVFLPASFCQSSTGNSDSEPEEKTVGFRLKPPTLIHGQAPSAGVPSQKPKEQLRTVLRPALLQAPPAKTLTQSNPSSGTNGVNKASDTTSDEQPVTPGNGDSTAPAGGEGSMSKDGLQRGGGAGSRNSATDASFVFGQNIKDRAKVEDSSDSVSQAADSHSGGTNYFLQYISTTSSQNAVGNADSGAKFIFGQNMSERVLSPPKCSDSLADDPGETPAAPPPELSTQEPATEKVNSTVESLEESAAAYTKATARHCLLEKVEVLTGEESESNVLQIQCKLFVFDKTSQSWVERGRGLLRLNDMASTDDGTLQSRLVMRTQGSLRLILNTKLWPQMQIDKASEKSLRITAMDTEDQGVKVFLISASSKDTGQLSAALHHRILALRSRAEQDVEAAPALPDVPQSNEDDSDEDVMAPTAGSAPVPPPAASPAPVPPSGVSEPGDAQHTGST
ncbi:ran-binding protein 3-like isoform X2 [Anguilla rostrata]|uniref:ran-binding protein 3-like isoform X2 n=1 Tax=Anguilla rostrata TaxID=7938 RepID=UPI0030D09981